MARGNLLASLVSFLLILNASGELSVTFTVINKCSETVWPGMLSMAGISPPLDITGFVLPKNESRIVNVPKSWLGRLWGRTHCSQDSRGNFSCITGDCGSGKVACTGGDAKPPATLAEFALTFGDRGIDFYDVSLADGFNLPMLVVPEGGTSGSCGATGCAVNLNDVCLNDLKVTGPDGNRVGCNSACGAFGEPQYCCTGAYANRTTCKPSSYSEFFKNGCPRAYSYAQDDETSTFTCTSANYVITFCPPLLPTSKKDTKNQEPAGGGQRPSSSSSIGVSCSQFLAGAVSLFILLLSSSAIWKSFLID
ncbi:hypothetical protein MKX03_018106 [Papaver bracteatum]|nr:hypothetical protein MKX03_018106 [Papaver bracteatum]